MSWQEEVNEIKHRESLAKKLGGKERIQRQHDNNRLTVRERIGKLVDKNSFHETSKWIQSLDPIEFSPRVSYRVRLVQDRIRTGLNEAIITGTCKIDDKDVVMIVIDSSFLGGSMGVVVGEKVTLALELAKRKKIP